MNMMVTGGSGFIGSHFIEELFRESYFHHSCEFFSPSKVINVDIADDLSIFDNKKYEYQRCDISSDLNKLRTIIKDVDCIVHFAGKTHVDESIINSSDYVLSNIIGTHNLLSLCLDEWNEGNYFFRNKQFIHFSTDEVFGSLDIDDPPFTINSPYNPTNPYSATKCASDLLVSSFIKTYQFPAIIINTTNNYGSRQYHTKLIPKAIYNCINGIDMPIHDHGQHIRNWFFVKDCVKCIVRIINSKNGVGKKYTIGGNVEHSTIEMLRIIEKFYFQYDNNLPKPKYKYIEDRLMNDFRYSVSNIEYEDDYGKINYSNFEETLCQTVYDLIEGIITDEKNI